jgi:mRNA interferase MazF
MQRGSFVTAAASGDYGKLRPALVVQSDLFTKLPSVVICP